MAKTQPLDALHTTVRTGTSHAAVWLIGLLILGFVTWSAFARLDEVAIAEGEVIPTDQLQVIQHLEGGVIEEIHVTEGASVRAGDVLLRLNLAAEGINRNELLSRRDALLLTQARLKAEAGGEEPVFPEDLVARQGNLAATERSTYEARQTGLKGERAVLQTKLQQRRLEVEELSAGQRAISNDLQLAKQRLGMSAELLADGLTPRMEHVEIEAEVERLIGQIDVIKKKLARARAGIGEAEAELESETAAFRRRASEELAIAERDLARVLETLNTADDQVTRSELRSPIDGVVKNMRTNTIGGVVRPGEPIVEIVPSSDALEVVAKLDPKDRGYVAAGMRATVKVSTYDFVRYGGLEGTVERISASTNKDERSGQPFYEVVVKTEENALSGPEGSFPITPGMVATVDIHTGNRTVLEFLAQPVLKLQHEAFRER